jgi:hypothetical protein
MRSMASALDGIDWSWLAMDGAMTKAPLGGGKTGPNPTDRGKGGVKSSLLTEAHGIPIAIAIDGANRHDMKLVCPTIEDLQLARPTPTPANPQGLCLDKGYDYVQVCQWVEQFGFTAHIRARRGSCRNRQRCRVSRPTLGRRTHARLDEPISRPADTLAEEGKQLPRLPSFGMRHHCLALSRSTGIGSNFVERRKRVFRRFSLERVKGIEPSS